MDRRVARTRTMLHRALNSLILEKGYEAITVTDICDAANIGRSTFYAHYASKDDLKRSGLDRHLRALLVAAAERASDRELGFSLPMFEHARDHLHLFRALSGGPGRALALCTIRRIVSDLVRKELAAGSRQEFADTMQREVAVQYVVGAFMAVMVWWLDGGAKLPAERMDAMFQNLVREGIVSGVSK